MSQDPRGRSVYDDVPINDEESEFREFDEDEGGEDDPDVVTCECGRQKYLCRFDPTEGCTQHGDV